MPREMLKITSSRANINGTTDIFYLWSTGLYRGAGDLLRVCNNLSHVPTFPHTSSYQTLGWQKDLVLRRKITVSGGKDHNRFGCYHKVSDLKDRTTIICIDQYQLTNLTS